MIPISHPQVRTEVKDLLSRPDVPLRLLSLTSKKILAEHYDCRFLRNLPKSGPKLSYRVEEVPDEQVKAPNMNTELLVPVSHFENLPFKVFGHSFYIWLNEWDTAEKIR